MATCRNVFTGDTDPARDSTPYPAGIFLDWLSLSGRKFTAAKSAELRAAGSKGSREEAGTGLSCHFGRGHSISTH